MAQPKIVTVTLPSVCTDLPGTGRKRLEKGKGRRVWASAAGGGYCGGDRDGVRGRGGGGGVEC